MLNIAFRLVAKIRKLHWWFFRPVQLGVKAIIEHEGKIVLIKNRYDSFWYLPGGGVKKNETAVAAIRREVKEEIGLEILGPQILGVYSNFSEYKNDHLILFGCRCNTQPSLKRGFEVEACEFYRLDSLPENTSPATRKRLNEYQQKKFLNGKW